MGLQDLDPDALLSRLTELGVLLRAEGDSLCYDAPSAVATAELLAALRKHRAPLLSRIEAGVERRGPLTRQQRAFVTVQPRLSVRQVYNVAIRITFAGPLDVAALGAALSALVARHETLRTRYVHTDGDWCQEVLRPRPAEVPAEDLRALPPPERDAEIERISARLAQAPFDLGTGSEPVFRLLRAGDLRWVLLVVLHHVSCDGWGLSVLLKDLAALYAAAVSGRPDGLPRPVQPIDYAVWQREQPVADERRLAYWSGQLRGAPQGIDLPTDRPRPAALSGQGDVVLFTVPADVRTGIEAYARRHGTTPFAVTAAAFGVLLSRLSGQQEIVVGVPCASRERRAHENLVACLVINFVLRIRLGEADSFAGLVDEVSRDTVGAISNIMPFGAIVAQIGKENVPNRMSIGFQYLNALDTEVEFPGMTVAIEDLAFPVARAEFIAGLIPAGEVLSGYAEYSTDLWDRETIEQWVEAYRELLREAADGRVSLERPASGNGAAHAVGRARAV